MKKTETFALAKMVVALFLGGFSVTVSARIEDCFGQNSDGGVPGQATCVSPILIPDYPGAPVDGEKWHYMLCDDYPLTGIRGAIWCNAMGGAMDIHGTCSNNVVFEPNIIEYGQTFSEMAHGSCESGGYMDSGWGFTSHSYNCWSGAPQYRNGILLTDYRQIVFEGKYRNQQGACSLDWQEHIVALRSRKLACPSGTNEGIDASGDMTCWYLPANNCETVGQNSRGGSGTALAAATSGTGGTGLAKSGCNLVGNPINTASMSKVQREEDLATTSGGLEFVRYYNSAPLPPVHPETSRTTWDYWRHTYMRRIVEPYYNPTVLGVAWRENGRLDYYDQNGKAFANLNGGASTLQKTVNGWVLAQGNGDKEYYDSNGKLQSLVALSGATQALTYSDANTLAEIAPMPGLLIAVTDGWGRQIHLAYDDASRLISMTDPAGNVFQYRYNDEDEDDRSGNLAQVIYPDQTTRSYLYEDARWEYALTGIVDNDNARLSTYVYNLRGEAIRTEGIEGANLYSLESWIDGWTKKRSTVVTNALGGQVTTTYSPVEGAYKPTLIVRRPCSSCAGTIESLFYDANGNLVERRPGRYATRYEYDPVRNLEIKRLDGVDTTWSASTGVQNISTDWHPALRLPIRIAEPQKLTTIAYDARGNILTRTVQETSDANGAQGFAATLIGTPRTWTNTYNAAGQLERSAAPDGSATDYTYYPANDPCLGCRGQVKTTRNALGHTTTFDHYDTLGRLTQSTDPNGLVTTQTYDWKGRLLTRTVHAGSLQATAPQTTTYTYDPAGQLIQTTQPDGTTLHYDYDAAGRLIALRDTQGNRLEYTLDAMSHKTGETVYDPQGTLRRTWQQQVDAFGTLQTRIDADGHRTGYSHDPVGNLTETRDPLGRVTQHQYDPLNRLTQTTDANQGVTRYAYNGQDQLTEVTDPRGLKTAYTYNGFGELISQTSPDTGTTTYTYDPAGRLHSKTDAKGTATTYGYDLLGRLTNVTANSPTGSQATAYTYDQGQHGLGRLTTITDPAGTTTYRYDALGNILQKTQTQGSRTWVVHYSYNAAGQLTSITYPSGTRIEYNYHQGKPIALKINGQTLLDNIAHEPFGPVSGWQWKTSGSDGTSDGTAYQRTYDQNGRTVQTTQPDLPAAWHHFDYDNLDRLTRAETVGASGNTVLRYGYDSTGNRRTASVNGTEDTYTTETASNRLIKVEGTTNLVTFQYDDNGSTIQQTGTNSVGFAYDERGRLVQANGTRYKINALEQRIEKQGMGANTPSHTRHFVYDEQGHLIGEYDPISGTAMIEHVWLGDWPVAAIKDGEIYYIYPDHLGTPRAITDTNNQAVWYWNYDEPFGKTTPNENPSNLGAFNYNLRFPGQYYDEETGLHYNGHRDYDPMKGRYIQSDPIGLRGGINTYAYVTGNPLARIDPEGKSVFTLPAFITIGGVLYICYASGACQALSDAIRNAWDREKDYCEEEDDCKKALATCRPICSEECIGRGDFDALGCYRRCIRNCLPPKCRDNF